MQHNAAATGNASTTTTLTIGGVSGTVTTTTAGPEVLSLTPASLDFADRSVGTTSPGQVATLTNTGGSNASFLPPTITGDFAISSTSCALSLAPGASCTIGVTFTPTTGGARAGTLTVTNFINPVASALTGTGVLDTTPDAFAFPSQPAVPPFSQRTSAAITPVGYNGPAAISVANGEYSVDCGVTFVVAPGTIAPGQSVCVRHNAAATGATSVTTTLTIGGVAGTFTSTTAAPAALSLAPTSLDFGDRAVGTTSAAITATLTNTGGSSASFFPPSVSGEFLISASDCGLSLPAGASCTVTVRFAPTGLGARSGTLTVTNFINPVASALTGTGAALDPADVTAIATGSHHTCALTTLGAVKCWGNNQYGSLGDNSTTGRLVPVDVSGLAGGVTAIAAGGSHSCAVTAAGGVKCWGNNEKGSLGDDSTTQRLMPVDVVGLASGIAAVAAGTSHTCALTTAGGVKCWGSNVFGALGDGSNTQRLVPVDVIGLASGVVAITAGGHHTCAIRSGGRAVCWGSNVRGQLGDGGSADRSHPIDVSGLGSGTAAISAGLDHACAVKTSGRLVCWGSDSDNQLGAAFFGDSHVPIDVVLPPTVAEVSAGRNHTCARMSGGGVKCWGSNNSGQLGNGTTVRSHLPVDVTGLGSGTTGIAAGGGHTCALTAPGGVKCWGSSVFGELGDGSAALRLTPVDVVGLVGSDTAPDAFAFVTQAGVSPVTTVTSNTVVPGGYYDPAPISVANGEYSIGCTATFTAAASIVTPGESVCVRHTSASTQLTSITTTLTIGGRSAAFVSTTAPRGPAAQVIVFEAKQFNGKTFGDSPSMLVATGGDSGIPVVFASRTLSTCTVSGSTLTLLAAGTCTVTANQAGNVDFTPAQEVALSFEIARAQQRIVFGVLPERGVGAQQVLRAFASSGLAVAYGSLSPAVCAVSQATVTALATGTCAVAADQAGDASFAPAARVVQQFAVRTTDDPADVAKVDAGDRHTCAVSVGGEVKCWGRNLERQLGDASTISSALPVGVVGLPAGAIAVGGGSHHTCAVAGGEAWCWGSNQQRQLGVSFSAPGGNAPVRTFQSALAIAAGAFHGCLVSRQAEVACWGTDGYGQLGLGPMIGAAHVPITILPSGAAAVALGEFHTCALMASGAMKCWGRNAKGQIGDASTTDRTLPVDVVGAAGVASIAAGYNHTCALTRGGAVKCWGDNAGGQLGNGSTAPSAVPVDVTGLHDGIAAIAAGGAHTCALGTTGAVKCWGDNSAGQLGDGTQSGRTIPTEVPGLSGVVEITAGGVHTCAVLAAGGVKCWGGNDQGQLGDGSQSSRLTPTPVAGLDGIDAIPQAFGNLTQSGVHVGSIRTFQASVNGFHDPAQVSIAGGEHSIGCTGTFTTAPGVLDPGIDVCVRHVAAAGYSESHTTTLTIGGVAGTFTSVTAPRPQPSVSPASVAFGNQAVGTRSAGQAVVVTNPDAVHEVLGLGAGVGGDFSIAGTTCLATLAPGASCTFTVAFMPLAPGARADELLVFSANGVPSLLRVLLSGTGSLSDTTPGTFAFVDQFLVPTNTLVTSAPVQITGLSGAAPISVIGGTYAISSGDDCSGNVQGFTANPGTIANGQFACVRHTSSAVPGGSNDTQLIVGGLGDTFTTVTRDPVPSPFAFGSQSNVALGTMRTSPAVPITGINSPASFSVSGGEVSVNCTGTFATTGTLAPGSTLCVRHRAAAGFNAATTTTVDVEGVQATFVTSTFTSDGDADDDGMPNGVEYNEARNPEAKDNDVFGNARWFAMQQYRDFLGREGDAGGIAYWTGQVDAGTRSRAQGVEDFFASPEFQGNISPVARLYFAYFLRIPDYAGLDFWIGQFQAGTALDGISNAFAQSAEFVSTYGALTDAQFVDRVYRNVLGRAPDEAGLGFWTQQLESGARTRGQVMTGFSESAEYRAEIGSEIYVTMMYLGMLRRAPDAAGFAYWVGYLDDGNPGLALISGFLGATEYRRRFLP